MRKPLFLLIWLLFACHISNAQVSRGGRPYSYSADLKEQITTRTIPSLSRENLRREDVQREKQGLPLRVGIISATDFSLNNTGTWSTLSNGDRVWRLKIDVKNALATSLYYDNFHLPEGASLFVYNEDHSQLIGSYTSANNQQGGQFATEILKGNVCIVEYYEPGSVRGQGRFTISGVNNIYSERIPEGRKQQKDFGDAGSCNVNVNCPEGANWQNQKRAVARILLRLGNAAYLCSGALVNNARSDCKPYFLTANHCGSDASASDFNQWIFYFNYEAPSCSNPANEPVSNTITGCVQRARSGDSGEADGSDFQLLQFTSNIPASYNVFYAGWNANDIASPGGVTIHHPAGDIKKISTYTTQLTNDNFNAAGPPYTHWKAVWAQTQTNWSVTEGGSSGSPLFNSIGQIVGQLSGGPSSCNASAANKNDEYGKMSYNWTSNGSDVLHQLRPWLDPDNTGILQLAGTNFPCGGDSTDVSCPDLYEPNNSLATAYTIVPETDIRGTINTPSDTDYFKVVIGDTSYLSAYIDNLGADFDLRLLSSTGALLATAQNTGITPDSLLQTVSPGTYYIQVYGKDGAVYDSICYRMNTFVQIIGGCTDQLESNNTLATAATIGTGFTVPALIASSGDVDYYRIITSGTNSITVNLSNLPADYDVRLLSSTGSQLGISQNGSTNAENINYNAAAAGTYYIQVYGYNGAFSASKCYHLLVNTTPVVACTNTFEPNNTRATAAAISANTEISSQISSSTDVDWFSFSNTAGQQHIEILLSNLPGDYDVYLYDSTGTLRGSSENGGSSSERIVYNNGAVGTYYVRVIGYNGASSTTICYRLTANISNTPKVAEVSKSRKTIDRELNVYPVPSTGKVYTEFDSKANKLQNIIVTDLTGKVVFTKQYRIVNGYNRLEIILPAALQNGIYIISDGTNARKVVLQR